MADPIILASSYTHASPVCFRARQAGDSEATTSLDLGLTKVQVLLEAERVVFPDGQWLPWDSIQRDRAAESVCFVVQDNDAGKIQRFSEALNRFYSLMPTGRAPTLLISGIPMHRIKGITPTGTR